MVGILTETRHWPSVHFRAFRSDRAPSQSRPRDSSRPASTLREQRAALLGISCTDRPPEGPNKVAERQFKRERFSAVSFGARATSCLSKRAEVRAESLVAIVDFARQVTCADFTADFTRDRSRP